MSVSAAAIKDLREKTGAGMMDCKKALTETNGNMEEAIDWLRAKGLAAAAKKAGRTAADGLVAVAVKGTLGAVVEVNAETDFVARNEQFQTMVENVATKALDVNNLEALEAAQYPATGRSVKEEIANAIAVIGENMNLRRAAFLKVEGDGIVASYVHNAVKPGLGKIGILVALKSSGDKEKLADFGRQIAMHIAASRPESLGREDLDASLVERERNIFREQAKASGKPDDIIEKMIEGRVRKYYEEVVLLEQVYVMDGKAKVSEAVTSFAKELGAPVELTGFVRFQLGEGIEKEADDFAAEVSKMAGAA